ncbi:MAG: hypothetical protein IPP63_10570 [Chloracidobacterium sp.]|nr:hypothetical protein [Chloracidobacterium sp.]
MRTKVDGLDPNNIATQLYATIDDFVNFGPINSGIILLANTGAVTPPKKLKFD